MVAEITLQIQQKDNNMKDKSPDKYEIQHMANTVADAHEIMNDPAKMVHVKKHLAKKQKAIKASLEQMKSMGADMPMDEESSLGEGSAKDKKHDKLTGEKE